MTTPNDFDAIVDGFTHGILSAYPDFAFLSPRGRLYVDAGGRQVRRIRIQVAARRNLHLHSLAIEGPDVQDAVQGATWSVSSSWSGFHGPAPGALFDPAGHHVAAFHSNLDQDPWLEVELPRSVAVDRLVIRNVALPTATRAAGIQVLVADAEPWRLVYDGAARLAMFRRSTAFRLGYPPAADELTAALTGVLMETAVGNAKQAQRLFSAIPQLSEEQRRTFRAAVSTKLLAARELEWTIHGMQRSFRYWPTSERRAYVGRTIELAHDLRELSSNVCFGFGAVLAVVRNGDLIPHDDDLDLLIGLEPSQATTLIDGIQLVRSFLGSRGYEIGGNYLAHQHVKKPDQSKQIDLFIGLFDGDRIDWYPGARGLLDRDTMFPHSIGPMLGLNCPLPRNPLIYLERIYGQGWRTPDPGFRHSWVQEPYADIAGPRTPVASAG